MDDLAGKLNEILNNPAEMAKLQQMASSLLGQTASAAQNTGSEQHTQPAQNNSGGVDLSRLAGLLGQQTASGQTSQSNGMLDTLSALGGLGNNQGTPSVSPEMLGALMKIAPLLGTVNQEDDNTRLLHALRPLLKSERQKKLDEAIKIMRMLKFLPLLKEQGILQGIL